MKPTLRRALSIAALAVLPAVALAPVAAATTVNVNYACQSTALGTAYTSTLTQPIDITAPSSVSSGAAFSIVLDPGGADVPADVGGYDLIRVQDLTFKLPIPANSTYVSSSLSGGVNVGTTSLTVASGVATLTASGPVSGGSSFELPTITLNLTAGAPGTSVQTTLYGTSYSNPGLSATGVVRFLLFNVNVPSACYPSPNPAITTTAVV
ncbi:cyclase [Actinokineospora sp. NBRC 105648]|uniref:cyclase n=1 Tax=Actinokineospora sp. NBRC 105648 TaxID=3032206 RepID=UPI0024A0DFE1|nr:cyclase [Actinokineospora sp. NBRC 105648]GLZ39629.1 cyclase [Actinokineospora sp. NBRC 105648]